MLIPLGPKGIMASMQMPCAMFYVCCSVLLLQESICHLGSKFLMQHSHQEILELFVAQVAGGTGAAAAYAADAVPPGVLETQTLKLSLTACHVQLHHNAVEQLSILLDNRLLRHVGCLKVQ